MNATLGILARFAGPGVLSAALLACVPRARQSSSTAQAVLPAPLLAEGSHAPDASALDAQGKPVRLSGFRGKLLVLYFYPMDFAAGSTAQAKEFAADLALFKRAGAVVVGVSTDHPTVHVDFAEKNKLRFPLLSDADGAMARAFGVELTGHVAPHVTFLIDRDGVIRKIWRKVRPWGHAEQVLAATRALAR